MNSHPLIEHLTLDTEIDQDDIFFTGITKSKDSTKTIIDLFDGNVPQENQIQHITPGNSDGFLSFTFDDFNIFKRKSTTIS